MPMKMASNFGLRTLRRIINSGTDIATTLIIKASAVPNGNPFSIRAWTIGIVPAALEYIGIPKATATKTASGLSGPA